MTDQFPDVKKMVLITPPPELLAQWEDDILDSQDNVDYVLDCAWRNGFQAGADQELEACCEWMKLEGHEHEHTALRAARRSKPPSLKKQALKALDDISIASFEQDAANTIRQALESLPD